MRRQSNQSNNFFNRRKPFRTNAVAPEIIVGPIWLHEDQPSSIEIIELNSSNEQETSSRERRAASGDDNNVNIWSYLNSQETEQIEDHFKINEKARERRRLQDQNHLTTLASTFSSTDANNFRDFTKNHYTNNIDERKFNHQMNCFNIFNKHFMDSDTDTSTDGDYGDVEIITSSDLILDRNNWAPHDNNLYNEEIVTYDTDVDHETRTVWIYSYKNKHLSDDDFAINDASKERLSTSTSLSTDSSGELRTADKSTSFCRLGSPTPPTYIPRLDLSLVPTLSTVTEISERNVPPTAKESNKSLNRNIKIPTNNWLQSKSAKLDDVKSVRKHEKSTNIINWMSLSPRERRRVIKDRSSSDKWFGSSLNLAKNNIDDHGDQTNDLTQNDVIKVLVNVEVHTDVNNKPDNIIAELKSSPTAAKSKAIDMPTVNKIKYGDEVLEDFQKDRGDHFIKLVVAPTIRLTPKKNVSTEITDPIETLESSNWIRDTREETVMNVYDYVLETPEPSANVRDERDAIVDRMWMRNSISFLKPSQWTAFAPITESPVLHLSLGSIVEERQKWYKRLYNFLKCCK